MSRLNGWKIVLAGVGMATAGAVMVTAGPLNPPGGPISSTYKTLTEVEPRIAVQSLPGGGPTYVITNPGSYYLTGNISVTNPGFQGIVVDAPNVTIDLNGFTLDGGGVGDDAIVSHPFNNVDGLVVKNGTISNWVKEGIDGYSSKGMRVENVRVRNSVAGYGIITGTGSVIVGCTVSGSAVGVVTTPDCSVQDCTAIGNTNGGFSLGSGSTAVRCLAAGSVTAPAPGFFLGNGCVITASTARANNGIGIDAGNDCTITDCSATSNTSSGIRMSAGGTIQGTTAARNSVHGIISTNGGTIITQCAATGNGVDGIRAGSGCLVLNNTATANGPALPAGGSGIFTTGNGARIEANTTVGNYYGVGLNGSNNFMVRNLSTGNTGAPNQLIAGNKWAQIINNPAQGFVSTDPWANVQY